MTNAFLVNLSCIILKWNKLLITHNFFKVNYQNIFNRYQPYLKDTFIVSHYIQWKCTQRSKHCVSTSLWPNDHISTLVFKSCLITWQLVEHVRKSAVWQKNKLPTSLLLALYTSLVKLLYMNTNSKKRRQDNLSHDQLRAASLMVETLSHHVHHYRITNMSRSTSYVTGHQSNADVVYVIKSHMGNGLKRRSPNC